MKRWSKTSTLSWLLAAIYLLASCSPFLDPSEQAFNEDAGPDNLDTLAPPLTGPPHLGFVYVGPVGDHGWTKTHDDSRQEIEAIFGIDTRFAPSVEPVDAVNVIEEMIDEGANVIISTSYDFLSATQQAAANHPEVNFLITAGFVNGPNLSSYYGRMYQVMWLAGRLAAQSTRTRRLGVVGAIAIPETIRHINAFTLGARSIDSEILVEVHWIQEWYNPELEDIVTRELVAHGADIIYTGTDTPIAVTVADELTAIDEGPVYSIGHDNPDTCSFAPNTCLTSTYFNWTPILETLIQQMIDGTWDPQEIIFEPMKGDKSSSLVYLAPINEDIVPLATIADVESYIPELANGSLTVFEGEILDNTGTLRVSGRSLSDEELLRMCWFVQGVISVDPVSGEDTLARVPAGCPGDY